MSKTNLIGGMNHRAAAGLGSGDIGTAANVGTGTGLVFRDEMPVGTLNFKSLKQGAGISIANNADDITITCTVTAGITGSGTINYLPKFTAATVISDSAVIDNATQIQIVGRQLWVNTVVGQGRFCINEIGAQNVTTRRTFGNPGGGVPYHLDMVLCSSNAADNTYAETSDRYIYQQIFYGVKTGGASPLPAATFFVNQAAHSASGISSDMRWDTYNNGTANQNHLYLAYTGYVGIGIVPSYKFHVESVNLTNIMFKNTGNATIAVRADANITAAGNTICEYRGLWNGSNAAQISIISGPDNINKRGGFFVFKTGDALGAYDQRFRICAEVPMAIVGVPAPEDDTTYWDTLAHGIFRVGNGIALHAFQNGIYDSGNILFNVYTAVAEGAPGSVNYKRRCGGRDCFAIDFTGGSSGMAFLAGDSGPAAGAVTWTNYLSVNMASKELIVNPDSLPDVDLNVKSDHSGSNGIFRVDASADKVRFELSSSASAAAYFDYVNKQFHFTLNGTVAAYWDLSLGCLYFPGSLQGLVFGNSPAAPRGVIYDNGTELVVRTAGATNLLLGTNAATRITIGDTGSFIATDYNLLMGNTFASPFGKLFAENTTQNTVLTNETQNGNIWLKLNYGAPAGYVRVGHRVFIDKSGYIYQTTTDTSLPTDTNTMRFYNNGMSIRYQRVESAAWVDVDYRMYTLTDAATIAIDAGIANGFKVTLGGARTLGNPTNPKGGGQVIVIKVSQDGAGTRTLAYDTKYRFSTGLPQPVVTTGANKFDYIGFIYNAADDKWDFIALVQGFN